MSNDVHKELFWTDLWHPDNTIKDLFTPPSQSKREGSPMPKVASNGHRTGFDVTLLTAIEMLLECERTKAIALQILIGDLPDGRVKQKLLNINRKRLVLISEQEEAINKNG